MNSSILVGRTNIGIFGKVNAGKSTLMNLLTSQETSIVDSKPGTTADVKQTLLQIHDFGPVKLFDTAGLNEFSQVGEKKKFKALQALKESDLILLVVNPSEKNFEIENKVVSLAREFGKQIFLIYNLFEKDSEKAIQECNEKIYFSQHLKQLTLNAKAKDADKALLDFIKKNFEKTEKKIELFPFLGDSGFVAMNIPVDEETPEGRLLRPQNVVLDHLLRRFIPFAGFRMDLTKARSKVKQIQEEEKQKYLNFLNQLKQKNNLQLVITDSQAIDVVSDWTPKEIALTTFSIAMIHFQSNGNLQRFTEGLRVLETLKPSDKIIIAEACNHDRKCNDIGTKQIPKRLEQFLGFSPQIEFVFGREFPPEKELQKYKLLIHCGGCMVDSQKVNARMNDLLNLNIPITNYGLLLSFLHGKDSLQRVLSPWGVE